MCNSSVKLFKRNYSDRNLEIRNTRLPDNNQERRPITIELNLNAVTLCDGESLPVSSLTFDTQLAPKPKTPSTTMLPVWRPAVHNEIWIMNSIFHSSVQTLSFNGMNYEYELVDDRCVCYWLLILLYATRLSLFVTYLVVLVLQTIITIFHRYCTKK